MPSETLIRWAHVYVEPDRTKRHHETPRASKAGHSATTVPSWYGVGATLALGALLALCLEPRPLSLPRITKKPSVRSRAETLIRQTVSPLTAWRRVCEIVAMTAALAAFLAWQSSGARRVRWLHVALLALVLAVLTGVAARNSVLAVPRHYMDQLVPESRRQLALYSALQKKRAFIDQSDMPTGRWLDMVHRNRTREMEYLQEISNAWRPLF